MTVALRAPGRPSDWLDCAWALGLTILLAACWAAHILSCVASGLWEFLVLGLVLFPVAILHGFLVLMALLS